jgi:hypothetical protein
MLNLFTLFSKYRKISINTIKMKSKIRHRMPGKFYFFNIVEEACYLGVYLAYAIPKLYLFSRKVMPENLTFFKNHVNVRKDGCI